MTLTIKYDAPTETPIVIPAGTIVEYRGHVIGGMVEVWWEESLCVIHPNSTVELAN